MSEPSLRGHRTRAQTADVLAEMDRQAFGPDAEIKHINWGDSHRRMLLYNRRHERAYQRSRRNQPPRKAR